MLARRSLGFILVVAAVGCRAAPYEASTADATVVDATLGPAPDPKIAPCASVFGTSLTQAFGRLDGVVLAVIPPDYQNCAMPNRTHLVLQVTMAGEAYRMVVATESNQGSPEVLLHELDAPLFGPAWAPGWHADGMLFDYATNLGTHSDAFVATPAAELVTKITAQLELGAKVSVYASSGDANSGRAHLVHRNPPNHDGAIVIDPDGPSPHYILMRYDEQLF